MPLSRLRLQLAASFAVVFLLLLGAADFALLSYLKGNAERDFTAQVAGSANRVAASIQQELGEGHHTVADASQEVLGEWPADSNGLVVYDSLGAVAAARGPDSLRRLVPAAAQLPPDNRTWRAPLDNEGELELAVARAPAYSVVAFRSTAGMRETTEHLALRLSLSVPLVVLLALIGAYFLARRALVPLHAMTRQITAIAPGDLDRRLAVRSPPDELDALAEQFNQLLERLSLAQQRNQRFLAQAAHQLRTPLTIIRGESGLALDRPRSADEYRDLLRRVSLAAEQMTHRVNDLFLLAQAEAGDRPPLTDAVELDGLVLECVDLMRGRAGALGRRLELGDVDAAEVTGNEQLIREAVLELIENACRYGDPSLPIRISAHGNGRGSSIEVASGGPPIPDGAGKATDAVPERLGLGLSIVRWIAAAHGGSLGLQHVDGVNTFNLALTSPATETQ